MKHSSKRTKHIPMLMAAGLLCATTTLQAAPVGFGISSASISAGAGYGVDTGRNPENGATLLDVRFDSSPFAAQDFWLSNVGEKRSFDLVTVDFAEPNTGSGGNKGIRAEEVNEIGLTTRFTLTDPVGGAIELTTLVTAVTGVIDDDAVDYAIAWTAVEADFGAGGRFRLSVDPLSFSNNGTQTARATVELLAAPALDVQLAAVPEPTSLALVGVALAGAGFVRRQRRT